MTTEEIGKKLNRYRSIKNKTIKDMSLKSGLSPALISQLERGIGNPTLSVLNALASAMEISISILLLEDIKNESMVFRKSERRMISVQKDDTAIYDVLAASPIRGATDMLLVSLPPHAQSSEEMSVHTQLEEIVFVLKGTVTLKIDEDEFVLFEGDSARILPSRLHMFINTGDEQVQVLFIQNKVMGL